MWYVDYSSQDSQRGNSMIKNKLSDDIEFNNLSELSTGNKNVNNSDDNNNNNDNSETNGIISKEKIRNRPLIDTITNLIKNFFIKDREKQLRSIENMEKNKVKSSFIAVLVGLLTAIGGFLYGYDTGIVNGLMEMNYFKTHFSSNHHNFTSSERAILTAILSLGTFTGSLIAPLFSDKYGRRFSMIITLLFILNIGIILQICSEIYGLLLAGRFLNGLGVGIVSSVVPLYQAEVSPSWIRGSIISMYQWAITWGLLVSSAISQGTRNMNNPKSFRIPIGLQFVWAFMLLIGFWFLPESPRYFVMKNDLDGAIISLSRFRRLSINDDELVEELIEIKASYDYEISNGKATYRDCFQSSDGRSKQLTRMLTCILIQACQQCSGINFIFYYGVFFFVGTGVDESYLMSLITYIVNVVFTIPGILLVDKIGRRKLLIIGALGMIVSNYVIAIVGLNTDSIVSNKVLLSFVCVFIAFFASSWGPVVWVVTGELFSLSIRQKAVSLAAGTNWIVNFVFAYSTPYIVDQGAHTGTLGTRIFFLWGSFNVLALMVTVLFVYETKGLMLEEVDELYRRCKYAYRSPEMNKEILRNEFYLDNNNNGDKTEDDNHNINHNHENNIDGNDYDNDIIKYNTGMTETGNNLQRYMTNNSSLSPMEHLRIWEQRHQRDNILSDNILAIHNDHYPSDELSDADNNEVLNSSVDGESNDDIDIDIDDVDFNYALYGDDHINNDENLQNYREDDDDNNNNDTAYHETLRAIIDDLSNQTGIDLHPRRSGSPNGSS